MSTISRFQTPPSGSKTIWTSRDELCHLPATYFSKNDEVLVELFKKYWKLCYYTTTITILMLPHYNCDLTITFLMLLHYIPYITTLQLRPYHYLPYVTTYVTTLQLRPHHYVSYVTTLQLRPYLMLLHYNCDLTTFLLLVHYICDLTTL